MRPPFSSTKSAAAFALFLMVLLLLPGLAGKKLLPPREAIYASTPWRYGPFHCLRQEIFEEKGDIDIAFVGSSGILHGIDAPSVQKELSKALGRRATVLTFGWSWSGFDALYFISNDLLRTRKVKMLVFTEECREGGNSHHAAPYWFRFAENAGALYELSWQTQAAYYFAAIVGMPRNLLELARSNSGELTPEAANTWNQRFHTLNPTETLGSISARLGFNAPFDQPNFSDYTPVTGITTSDVCIYSPATKGEFQFSGPPCPLLQLHFAREFGALAAQYHTPLVCLHLPETAKMRNTTIRQREFWPQALGAKVEMIGIPPVKLFAGMKDEEVQRLFLDPYHLNANGAKSFTRLIVPALIQIYESQNYQ